MTAEELRELRHEVGNALASTRGYADLLLRRPRPCLDDLDHLALVAIRDGVTRAISLLDRTPSPDPPLACDLRVLLARSASQMPAERWHDTVVHVRTDNSLIGRWHGERIVQVLANLLDNAAKYSPPGSPIEVELTRVAQSARVVVRDRGIGIETAWLDAIFSGHRTEPARRMAPGSGIGLQLSRGLAEAEGGRLWATSAPGEGSAFYLELPLAESSQTT